MPFDANLVLIDGSVNYTAATDDVPTSTTRAGATGAAVIDLKQTSAKGLACVLVIPAAPSNNADYIAGTIEVSSVETFASDVHELGKFDIAAATQGRILGSEVPATVIRRFATTKRYARFNGTVTPLGDGNFGKVQVLLSPYPFKVL